MSFSATDFMNEVAAEGGFDTSIKPVPEGDQLARVSSDPSDLRLYAQRGSKDPTKVYAKLTIVWDIIDENLKAAMGRERLTVRDDFFLDADVTVDDQMNITSFKLHTGPDKNVALGARRAALGMNEGAFKFSMFIGAGPAIIRVKHRSDANDSERKYAEVSRVTARK